MITGSAEATLNGASRMMFLLTRKYSQGQLRRLVRLRWRRGLLAHVSAGGPVAGRSAMSVRYQPPRISIPAAAP